MEELSVKSDLVLEMAENGALSGHKRSKTHPKMRQYVGANRSEIELIKPEAVIETIPRAADFLKNEIARGGIVLFSGTTPPARDSIRRMAESLKCPFVINRWLGGTLTNFKVIRTRLDYYLGLKDKKEKGELSKYTKKERVRFDKELEKLTEKFEGIVLLSRLPNAIFVVDIKENKTAISEARKMKIPIVAIVDTDDDPETVDYPIFATDHVRSGIEWVIGRILENMKSDDGAIAEDKNPTVSEPEGVVISETSQV